MLFARFLIAVVLLVGTSTKIFACHEGGAMGFASGSINGLVIDITSMPTFIFASTSGTSNCKNWDFANATEQERYVASHWDTLAADSAKGSGSSIDALATLSQCSKPAYPYFQQTIHQHYKLLFLKQVDSQHEAQLFLQKLQNLIKQHSQLSTLC